MSEKNLKPAANPVLINSSDGGVIQNDPNALLTVNNLQVHFPITQGIIFQHKVGAVRAVDGVTFQVRKGETLGVVGEFWVWQKHYGSGYFASQQTYRRPD